MCKYKVQELIALADDMAAGAASLALGPQNYQQFVESRERVLAYVQELMNCDRKSD